MVGGWLKDGEVGGGDDLGGLDLVGEAAAAGLELDFIADTNIAQRTEKCVAVGCEGDVARFAGQRGMGKVADSAVQGSG